MVFLFHFDTVLVHNEDIPVSPAMTCIMMRGTRITTPYILTYGHVPIHYREPVFII